MTVGSLFAGIGGFDLGLERAGMEIRWQVENNEHCNRVLAKHWPHVKRYGDIRELSGEELEPVNLVCGGFPCQDLSVAGRREGLSGERSGLFHDLVRLVSVIRPAWVVLENVPGLLTSNGGRDMGTVVGRLEDAGYSVAWRVLDAQWFGVPQRRRRVFLVCHSDPERAAAVLFEPEGGEGHPATVRKAGADIAHCIDGRTGGVSGKENQRKWRNEIDIDNIVFNPQSGGKQFLGIGEKPTAITGSQQAAVCSPVDADGMRKMPGAAGPLDVCRQCREGPDAPRYRAIGNAVVPQVAEWIVRRIIAAEPVA